MRMYPVISGSVASVLIGTTIFAQQPVQVQQNQNPPRQIPPTSGQVIPGQTTPGQSIPGQSNPGQVGQGRMQGQQQGMHSMKEALATCLAIGNQEEVQLAKMGKEKASNEDVKKFASMLIEEHQAMLNELRRIEPNTAQVTLESAGSSNDRGTSTETTQQNRNQTTPYRTASSQSPAGTSGSSTFDFTQIHREIAEQCLSDAKEKLSDKSESEFDKCFVGMQIAKHAGMVSTLKVFERHADSEMKTLISDGLEKTKKHLEVAENLMERLDEGKSSKKNRKSE